MKRYLSIPMLALIPAILTLLPAPASAALKSPYLDSLQRNFYVEACKSKLGAALKGSPCRVAPRLNAFIAWMDSMGNAADSVMGNALKDRYASLTDPKRYAADMKGWPLIGDPAAPLTVVMYFSGTCPLCKNNFVDLEHETLKGSLKGRVRILAKPFGENIVNKALVAAHDMGRFSDFMRALATVKVRIDEDILYDIADAMYLDRDKFKAAMVSPSVAARVDAAHSEGKKNGVELVPTYFIGGRLYNSVSTPRWIIDAFEYTIEERAK
jgi:protein-disulfide isomerase